MERFDKKCPSGDAKMPLQSLYKAYFCQKWTCNSNRIFWALALLPGTGQYGKHRIKLTNLQRNGARKRLNQRGHVWRSKHTIRETPSVTHVKVGPVLRYEAGYMSYCTIIRWCCRANQNCSFKLIEIFYFLPLWIYGVFDDAAFKLKAPGGRYQVIDCTIRELLWNCSQESVQKQTEEGLIARLWWKEGIHHFKFENLVERERYHQWYHNPLLTWVNWASAMN